MLVIIEHEDPSRAHTYYIISKEDEKYVSDATWKRIKIVYLREKKIIKKDK